MNVFIVGSPLETAKALDGRRLKKQIIECRQMIRAMAGETKAWSNHPCTIQYSKHRTWLSYYMLTLSEFAKGHETTAEIASRQAMIYKPAFHTEEYLDQMKRRLYTKDPEHYSQWSEYGTSEVNWYWSPSENAFIYYSNGKRIKP